MPIKRMTNVRVHIRDQHGEFNIWVVEYLTFDKTGEYASIGFHNSQDVFENKVVPANMIRFVNR